jgi:hypothetical protein
MTEHRFHAVLQIVGVNPFVSMPDDVLENIFAKAGKCKGFIPVKGTINGNPYRQTLVKYKGLWRLYINTSMLKNSPKRIGEEIEISIMVDEDSRTITAHPKLVAALENDMEARRIFDGLSPSRRQEIVRYISFLKTEESVDRNIKRAMEFLHGRGRFVGREKP